MQDHGEYYHHPLGKVDGIWPTQLIYCSPRTSEKPLHDGYSLAVCDVIDLECDTAPGCSYTESFIHQLDTNLLASGVLLSPFCTLARLPGVATVPVLRTISSLGSVLVATSFATSAIFRLRMKFVRDSARAESLAEAFHRAQSGHWSLRYIAVASPAALIYGSIVLFLVSLFGWTLAPNSMQTISTPVGPGNAEFIVLICAVACGLVNCGLALRTAFKLGRSPDF